jgi:hypothetical protein
MAQWDVGFELLGVGYGMLHGNAHANICVVIFGARDIDPLPCNSSVATARARRSNLTCGASGRSGRLGIC